MTGKPTPVIVRYRARISPLDWRALALVAAEVLGMIAIVLFTLYSATA